MPKLMTIAALCALFFAAPSGAADWQGLLDVRAQLCGDAGRSWVDGGLGKLRTDDGARLYLGQAVLRGEGELSDTLGAVAVLNAYQDRSRAADLSEAWLAWRPVSAGPWRTRVRAGAFFPALSLENDGPGWTPTRTLSTSAVNSWLGEELRIKGVELNLARSGRVAGSAHDFGVTATLFKGNDPIGTLMTWRGWSVGDRVTGLSETLRLPDLAVYRPGAPIARQTRAIHPMREIDGRAGYMLAAHYGYGGWLDAAAAHYDNRGDPLVVRAGQYSWTTRFDHASLRVRPGRGWEVALQALDGYTVMGPNAAAAEFRAWYALVSHPLAAGELALRYDHFLTRSADILPGDANDEDGRGWALAWDYPLAERVRLVAEALRVRSRRPNRAELGEAPNRTERSLTLGIRFQY